MYGVVLMAALAGSAELPDHHNRGGGCMGGGYGCSGFVGGHGCNGGGIFRGHGGGHGCSGFGGGYGGGYGCSGYGGGYGCSGFVGNGCSGGRHGHGGGLFGRRHGGHGCNGGGYGCTGFGGYGGGYGCTGYGGGYGGGYGCTGYGGGYGGGYGCTGIGGYGMGGYGCVGGMPYMPPVGGGKEMVKPPVNGDKKPPMDEVAAPATLVVNLPADAKLIVDGRATTSTSAVRTFVSPTLQPNREYAYNLTAEVLVNGQVIRQSRQVAVRAGQQTDVNFDFTTTVGTSR